MAFLNASLPACWGNRDSFSLTLIIYVIVYFLQGNMILCGTKIPRKCIFNSLCPDVKGAEVAEKVIGGSSQELNFICPGNSDGERGRRRRRTIA